MANKFLNYLYDQFLPSLNSQENTGFLSGVPAFQDTNLGGWSQENFVAPLGGSPLESPLSAQSQGQTLANQPTINTKVSSPLIPQGKPSSKKGSEQILGAETKTTEPRSGSSLSKIGNILSMIGATVQDVDPGSRGGGAVQKQLLLQEQLRQGEAQRGQTQWEKGLKEQMFGFEKQKHAEDMSLKKAQLAVEKAKLNPGGVLDQKASLDVAQYFTTKLDPQMAKMRKIESSYNKLKAMTSKPSETGLFEVGAVYSFLKAIDEGSVVRPGEIDLVNSANPMFNRIAQVIGGNTLKTGQKLGAKMMKEISAIADDMYNSDREQFVGARDTYVNQARQWGLHDKYLANIAGYNPKSIKTGSTQEQGPALKSINAETKVYQGKKYVKIGNMWKEQ